MRYLGLLFIVIAYVATPHARGDDSPHPLRALTSRDRVLVLAPHPDDESLGAAGLIEKTVTAHAKIRVVVATNGEANPWAQRFVEHRIQIGTQESERWGKRRQSEALRALATLGVSSRNVIFLNLPDQGVTKLLMQNDSRTRAAFRRAISDWKPTIAVFPSRYDLHPDHNACFVFMRLALGPATKKLMELEYLVHQKPLPDARGRIVVKLTLHELEKKREAILCYASQTALSRQSLVAFARPEEIYYAPGAPHEFDANHPLARADKYHDMVGHISDLKTRRAFGAAPLLLVGDRTRQTLRLPHDKYQHFAVTLVRPTHQLFVKVVARGLFLDKAGWREVPVK